MELVYILDGRAIQRIVDDARVELRENRVASTVEARTGLLTAWIPDEY